MDLLCMVLSSAGIVGNGCLMGLHGVSTGCPRLGDLFRNFSCSTGPVV